MHVERIPDEHLARIADILRIGNRAARAAQQANRKRGIPNWYSLGDRLVSDTGEVVLLHSPHSPEAAGRA